jgi:hypothetical protein
MGAPAAYRRLPITALWQYVPRRLLGVLTQSSPIACPTADVTPLLLCNSTSNVTHCQHSRPPPSHSLSINGMQQQHGGPQILFAQIPLGCLLQQSQCSPRGFATALHCTAGAAVNLPTSHPLHKRSDKAVAVLARMLAGAAFEAKGIGCARRTNPKPFNVAASRLVQVMTSMAVQRTHRIAAQCYQWIGCLLNLRKTTLSNKMRCCCCNCQEEVPQPALLAGQLCPHESTRNNLKP